MTKIKLYVTKTQSDKSSTAKGTVDNPYTEAEYESMLNNGTWQGGYVQNLGYCLKEVVVSSSYPDSWYIDSEDSWPFDDFDSWSDPSTNIGGDGATGQSETGGSWGNNTGSQGGSLPPGSGGPSSTTPKNPYPQVSISGRKNAIKFALVENVGLQASYNCRYTARITGYNLSLSAGIQRTNFEGKEFWAIARVRLPNQQPIDYKLTYDSQGYIYGTGWSVIGSCTITLPKDGNVQVELIIGYQYDSGIGYSNQSCSIEIYPQGFKQ